MSTRSHSNILWSIPIWEVMSAFCILEQQMIITACTLPSSIIQMNIEISFRKKNSLIIYNYLTGWSNNHSTYWFCKVGNLISVEPICSQGLIMMMVMMTTTKNKKYIFKMTTHSTYHWSKFSTTLGFKKLWSLISAYGVREHSLTEYSCKIKHIFTSKKQNMR